MISKKEAGKSRPSCYMKNSTLIRMANAIKTIALIATINMRWMLVQNSSSSEDEVLLIRHDIDFVQFGGWPIGCCTSSSGECIVEGLQGPFSKRVGFELSLQGGSDDWMIVGSGVFD